MKIYKYDVPDKLIFQYCKIIIELEKNFSVGFEKMREDLHNQIFESVKCNRSLYRKDDRLFSIALDTFVSDVTYTDYGLDVTFLKTPMHKLFDRM